MYEWREKCYDEDCNIVQIRATTACFVHGWLAGSTSTGKLCELYGKN